jgi:hypothetical protein
MIKYTTALRLGTAETEAILRRLLMSPSRSSDNVVAVFDKCQRDSEADSTGSTRYNCDRFLCAAHNDFLLHQAVLITGVKVSLNTCFPTCRQRPLNFGSTWARGWPSNKIRLLPGCHVQRYFAPGDTNVFTGPRNEVDQFEMKSIGHEVRYGFGA